MEPSKELEKEIMEFIFNHKGIDHNACYQVWKNNPWEAVALYEEAMFPEMLALPLATKNVGVMRADSWGAAYARTAPRASEGVFLSPDGRTIIVNRFGRVENEEDIYGEEE